MLSLCVCLCVSLTLRVQRYTQPLSNNAENVWRTVADPCFSGMIAGLFEEDKTPQMHISPCHSAAEAAAIKEHMRCQHTKHSYWFSAPLSKQRMAISPPKLSVIFDFDTE